MKKMKKFFCMMIVFVCCLKIYAINPVYAEEISETTENSRDTGRTLAPPQEKDWTDTNVQNDVWDIFASTTWNDGLHINFTLGDQGIAMADAIDDYTEFQDIFEAPLSVILEKFDENEAEGKVVTVYPHTYKYVEYEKIVACVLYSIYVREYPGFNSIIYSFTDENANQKITFLDFCKTLYNSFDEDQQRYFETAKEYYLTNLFRDYAIDYLGYDSDTVKTALWTEAGWLYFGTGSIDSLDTLVKRILNEITKYNGTIIGCEGGETATFEFDPYESKNILNYVCLDSVVLRGASRTLFDSFVTSNNFSEMADEFNSGGADSDGTITDMFDWSTYGDFYDDYIYNNFDTIYYCQYNTERLQYTDSNLSSSFYITQESVDKDDTNSYGYTCPAGSQGKSIGQFYYDNYHATKIVNHTINGITGEIKREGDE